MPVKTVTRNATLRKIKFGTSDMMVTEACIGTMTWGSFNDKIEQAFEQLDKAIELGANFIDTAELYPVAFNYGKTTEAWVGKWLSSRVQSGAVNRKDLYIATKANPNRTGGFPEGETVLSTRCLAARPGPSTAPRSPHAAVSPAVDARAARPFARAATRKLLLLVRGRHPRGIGAGGAQAAVERQTPGLARHLLSLRSPHCTRHEPPRTPPHAPHAPLLVCGVPPRASSVSDATTSICTSCTGPRETCRCLGARPSLRRARTVRCHSQTSSPPARQATMSSRGRSLP